MRSLLVSFLLGNGLMVLHSSLFAQKQVAKDPSIIQNSFIWSSSIPDGKQAYIEFHKSFDLGEITAPASLQLFADSRYLLWINGQYVLRGPCRFNPKRPEYDVIDVGPYLKKGRNSIAILVHYYAGAINGRIMKHVPGLTAVLEIKGKLVLRTNSTWKWNYNTMYQPSPESWGTIPDVIDGRVDDGAWIKTAFDDSAWAFAKEINGGQWGNLYPRGLPLAKEMKINELKILPARESIEKSLPVELSVGKELLVDFGRMAMAYTSIELNADSGSVLMMQYALQYKDGKLIEMYGDGNRYTARLGKQSFITTDQWVSRYLLIKCISGRIRIDSLSIIDRRYPFERLGRFECNDPLITRLWDMAVNSIEVTSDDGYGSDARERNEWIQDASKPSFYTTRVASAGAGNDGRLVFSDPRLLKNMLRHAALSQLPNGRLLATFPTDRGMEDCHFVIDDYACQWFEALQTYYDATADKVFLMEMWPTLVAQIDWFLQHRTKRGLLLAREYTSFDNPLAYITCEGTTVNAFFYQALKSSSYLAEKLGKYKEAVVYKEAANRLKKVFNQQFWNKAEMAYNSAIKGDTSYGPTTHAQLIALHYGLTPLNRKKFVQRWFLNNYKNAGMKHVCENTDVEKMIENKMGVDMPIVYFWVFSQLYQMDTGSMDQEAIDEIRRRWIHMVNNLQSAGTLGESFIDELGNGSSEACHNYGSTPAYFISSYILGVRRRGPVWEKHLLIEPRLGDLKFAHGVVVTEFGTVPVSWTHSDDKKSLNYQFEIPRGVRAEIHFPKLSDRSQLKLNGKIFMENGIPINGVKVVGRWIIVRNVSGKCMGTIK